MQRGDHACVIYSAGPDLIAVVAAYLHEGLRAGERCWYAACSPRERSDLTFALQARDIDVTEAEARGSLRLMTAADMYLADGIFDPERMLQELNAAILDSVHDGFTAFRVAGEMSWALEPKPGTDRVIEYESLVEMLLRASAAQGLCVYHSCMPAALLDGALTSHPLAGAGGRPGPKRVLPGQADCRSPHSAAGRHLLEAETPPAQQRLTHEGIYVR
jgi:hypothetical protein